MGGKTKQNQRTKNNVRPSSSGRSALLLSNVKLESGVMNIGGTELPALFPTLVAPNIDPLVSPELQLCIKKLNKKDPITKTKALQELSELVVNSKVDDVVAALPSWAHFYKILTADPDRKVREATQSCHGCIVSVCGRRLAPHLKQLMCAWLQAQYDEHAPAQTHAHNSLTKTFPDSKLPEVISFCKNEIMSHLVDNLIGAGESAYIRKTDSAEERQDQQARIITCSLHGLQYTVQHLPATHTDWLWEQLAALFKAKEFWKRATSQDSRIRAAWYCVVGGVVERYQTQFAAQFGSPALRALVAARETSPLCAAMLWDSLLLFLYNVQDWHKYLDKKELLAKRIFDLLENGGWGDARHLSNMLLPLLAHLPTSMLTKHFYNSFFQAIFSGFDKKTILSSKSERQSWITSLDECLRYLSIQQEDYVLEVVTSVHRTWLEKVLSDTHDGPIRTNLIKYSTNKMAALIKYWLKQAKECQNDKYDQLIRNFWQNVGSTITMQIDKLSTNHADIARLIDGHILLLQTLKTSFTQEAKKQQSIKFDGDSPSVVEQSPIENPQCDASIVERYNHNLNDLVEKVCGHYFEFANKKQISSPVLTPLITLLIEFDGGNLFAAIARHFNCDSTYKFYVKVLRNWLAGDTMRCKAVVDIIFLFIKHLSEPEQVALFDSFKQFPPSVVEWCISLSLSHPHCESPSVRGWMRGTLVESTVSHICTRVTEFGDLKAKDLLLMCLDHDAKGEAIINKGAISKIVEQLSRAVSCVQSPHLELVARVAAQLAASVTPPPLAALVLALLQLTVQLPRGDSRLSVDTWREVCAAWQDGMQALQCAERRALLCAAGDTLHRDASVPDKSLDLKRMEHVLSLCPYLLTNNSQLDIQEIVDFTKRMFDIPPNDPTLVEAYVLRHDIVKGDINCPFEDSDVTKIIINDHTKKTVDEMTKEDLITYMHNCVFRAMYLRTIFLHKVDEDLEDTWCNDLLADDYFAMEFCKVMYDFVVISSMYDAYAFWPHYPLIREVKSRMDTLLEDIVTECTLETKSHLLNTLSELAASKGYYWSFARRLFEVQAKLVLIDEKSNENQTSDAIESETKESQSNTECLNLTDNQDVTESQDVTKDQNKVDSLISSETINKESEIESKLEESPVEDKTADAIQMDSLDLENLKDIVTGSGFFHTLQANDKWNSNPASSLRVKYLLMLRSFYSAHAHTPEVVGDKFLHDVTAGQAVCSADVIVNAYYTHNHVMLYERDISSAPWSQVASNAAVADYLSQLIAVSGWEMAAYQWDFATITLCHLLSSLHNTRERLHWGCSKMALLTRSVLHLYTVIEKFISSIKERCMKQQPSDQIVHLPHEWKDIFAPDLHYNLFSMLLYVLESSTKTKVTANHIAVVDALIRCTRQMQWDSLPALHKRGEMNLQRLVRIATRVLQEPTHYCFKYLAYDVLKMLLKPLVLEDAEKLAAWSNEAADDSEDRPRPHFTLLYYDDAFYRLQEIVETAVSHVEIFEASCELVEFTDVHGLALSLFLLAEVMAEQCRLARGDLKHHYIQIYREQKYAVPLLETSLRLLPAQVLPGGDNPAEATAHAAIFTELQQLHVYKYCSARSVSVGAARGLTLSVCGAGDGEVRGWRGAAPHRHATLLDTLVRRYIAPQMVKEQFNLIQQRASELEDTEITIHWSTYECTCILRVEQRPIELKVQLSRSHPLGLPKFEVAENAPLTNTNWLVMYMGYQNGSLLNAVKMWIAAVTSKVERSSQCYICYCRLHFATGRLPAAYCHQCRNKFHTACLRKWFTSSNKSNCPLCRSPF